MNAALLANPIQRIDTDKQHVIARILADAREYAQQKALSYAGGIAPHDAWFLIKHDAAVLKSAPPNSLSRYSAGRFCQKTSKSFFPLIKAKMHRSHAKWDWL